MIYLDPFLSASLESLCILNLPLLLYSSYKNTFPLVFSHIYVLLSPDFDDIDNTAIAKKTHVLSAFAHTYVLLSPDFDDIYNTSAF